MTHCLALFVFTLLFCMVGCKRNTVNGNTRLVLLIVVDQLWYPLYERYADSFTGGFRTLRQRAARFSNASHDFSTTETCPGHATIVSGTWPSQSGVIANSWHDRASGKERYCVSDSYYGTSPRTMKVTGLPDWLKGQYPDGRAFSVAGKDRSAVMLAGRKADGAFWYSKSRGKFVTSRYYDLLDEDWWLQSGPAVSAAQYFSLLWSPLALTNELYDARQKKQIAKHPLLARLPLPLGSASLEVNKKFNESIYKTPFLDSLSWQFAKHLMRNEQLGTNPEAVDYLALGFSAMDTVGHSFGPESKEALDTLFRLDALLADVFQTVDEQVGLDNTLIVLTSDHGVQTYPEVQQNSHKSGRRVVPRDVACMQRAGLEIKRRLGVKSLWKAPLVLNFEELRSKRLAKRKVDAVVREVLEDCAMVERVWLREELLFQDSAEGSMRSLFARSITKDRGADYLLQSPEGLLLHWPSGTGHGSPYWYDRHVPLLIAGKNIQSKQINTPVSTVAVAPTIAELLGLKTPHFVTGKSLVELLQQTDSH